MTDISKILTQVLSKIPCHVQVADCMTVDFPTETFHDDGIRASDTVFCNYYPNMIPQYHQSATETRVDYQSDQSFRYLYPQFAIENTLANACPYETPLHSLAKSDQDLMVPHNYDESAGRQPGSSLSAQAVMGTSSQMHSQAPVSDSSIDTRNNTSQLSHTQQHQQYQLLETQPVEPSASPRTGSAFDLIQSMIEVFWNTEKFGNHDLPELLFTTRENSMDAVVRFAVKNPAGAIPDNGRCSETPAGTLTKTLTMLADKALKVPGQHAFCVYSDKTSTEIHIPRSDDASGIAREVENWLKQKRASHNTDSSMCYSSLSDLTAVL